MNTPTIQKDTREETTYGQCVLYIGGMFGYRRVECRTVKIKIGRHAQYDHALFVEYVEKGKRKAYGFVCYSHRRRTEEQAPGEGTTIPFVVLDASIDAPPTFIDLGGGASRTRFASCDPAWDREFHAALSASGARVLFDGRDGGRVTP